MTTPEKKPPFYRRRRFRRAALWSGIPVVAAGLFFVSHAWAGPACPGMRAHHGLHGPMMHAPSVEALRAHMQHRLDRLLSRVDAREAQREQASRIADRTAQEMFALGQQGKALREQLKAALLVDPIDQAKVRALGDEVEATVGQATRVGIEAMGELAAVLDKSQRQQVSELFARFER